MYNKSKGKGISNPGDDWEALRYMKYVLNTKYLFIIYIILYFFFVFHKQS